MLVVNGQFKHISFLFMTPLEFFRDFWQQKTRVPGLSYGVVCTILHLAVLVLVTDRRTDGQTHDDSR